jgi:hypothetical protein
MAPSRQPAASVYDAPTAVVIHMEERECVTSEAGTTT